VDRALDVFEWMAEGRGAYQPVVADTTTYNILIKCVPPPLPFSSRPVPLHPSSDSVAGRAGVFTARCCGVRCVDTRMAGRYGVDRTLLPCDLMVLFGGLRENSACKQKGMLEKALEVFTWMQGSGCAANGATYESLILTVEEAREWDDGISLGTPVEGLRPAPYDGMRCVYMEHHIERSLDERLAEIKLGEASWAPHAMRSPAAPGDREREAAGAFEPSLYDFMEERDRGPKKGFWASRGQSRGGLALSNASLSTSLLRPRTMAGGGGGGGGAAGASSRRSLTAEASFRPKGARLGRLTPDPSLQPVHSLETHEVNPWSPQASAYRRPPPLSAKEMVLARQHHIDSNEYRLA